MTPDQIQSLVSISFALEALFEKDGCTTRSIDLPGKPLESFIIAGVNVGPAFRHLAEDLQRGTLAHSFVHFPEALLRSNDHKDAKTVNFGLLEILFLVVHGFLSQRSGQSLVSRLDELLDENGQDAVQALLEARHIAWKSSTSQDKRGFDATQYASLPTMRQFYTRLAADYPASDSNHQWAMHALGQHPILTAFYADMPRTAAEMLEQVPDLHRRIQTQFPDIKIGILADMCAAAVFARLAEAPL